MRPTREGDPRSGGAGPAGEGTRAESAVVPATLEEALRLRAEHAVRPIAGGTDLVVRHRRGADLPADIGTPPLFIGRLPELRRIAERDGLLSIGAAVTLAELGRSPLCPSALREVVREFASPAVRTLATVGGNICNASPAGDLLPPFYAHEATVELASTGGRRVVPIAEFITAPGATALGADELLVAVHVAPPTIEGAPRTPDYTFYRKVAARRSNALSKLSVYIAAWTSAGRLRGIAIAVGAVAPTVVRLPAVERALVGADAGELSPRARAALEEYAAAIHPIDDQRSSADYRRDTALRLLRFVLTEDLPRHLQSSNTTEEP